MRVWLLLGEDRGVQAWGLDHIGFATWAPSKTEALARVPAKFEEHRRWLQAHGLGSVPPEPGLEIVEEIGGNEPLFGADRGAATVAAIDRTLSLLEATRSDLIGLVEPVSEEALDWDPPYRWFASWARWRTVREVIAHLANTETHYYLAMIGFSPPAPPVEPNADWRVYLHERRTWVRAFLADVRGSSDLGRVDEEAGWSARKALRRLVRHEDLHTKSIRRVLAAYQAP